MSKDETKPMRQLDGNNTGNLRVPNSEADEGPWLVRRFLKVTDDDKYFFKSLIDVPYCSWGVVTIAFVLNCGGIIIGGVGLLVAALCAKNHTVPKT